MEREPARVRYHGREVVTNPPPSSGGILVADALAVLERIERPGDAVALAETFAEVNRARDEAFLEGLRSEGYLERFLAKDALDNVATEVRSRLGNTTHLSVMDADGACVSVTCSNGSCSGRGRARHRDAPEQHARRGGPEPARLPPPRAGRARAEHDVARRSCSGTGRRRSASARPARTGSARRSSRRSSRSSIDGATAAEAVRRPRLHVEGDVVEAEPGIDEAALDELERRGWTVRRWQETNLFFGGVQAVARSRDGGELTGGGDPRRGGVAVRVD